MTDEEATLVVTAGTAMYGLDVLGGLIAGEGVVVTGPGPIGLLGVACRQGARRRPGDPHRYARYAARARQEARRRSRRSTPAARTRSPRSGASPAGKGVALRGRMLRRAEALNEAAQMVNRGGRICLAAFPQDPVPVDLAYLVRNNIYVFGIRGEGQSATHRAMALMKQKRFDARLIHTHTFPLDELPTALKYAREQIEDAIKVVVKSRCRDAPAELSR